MLIFEHKLIYERTDDMSVLSDFYCDIGEMDDFIHNKLQACIDRSPELETYIVYEEDVVVALASFKESHIQVEIDEDRRFCAPSLEIEYLAVRNKLQKKHIGSDIMKWIFDKLVCEHANCQYLSVRAYRDTDINYSAVPFYRKFCFQIIKKPHPMANAVKMACNVQNIKK